MFTGLSLCTEVTRTTSAILTMNQLGGEGVVHNRALAIPGHLQALGSPVASLEYVIMSPFARIGAHTQRTDEIYWLVSGEDALLTTNGDDESVRPGDLVVAPKGTRHAIRNLHPESPLAFLVVEVRAPESDRTPFVLHALPRQLRPDTRGTHVPVRQVTVELVEYCSGPWGPLQLIELPPGGRLHAKRSDCFDQNLFVPFGNATLLVGEDRLLMEGFGLNAFLPRGLTWGLINESIRDPLLLLLVQVAREQDTPTTQEGR